jgi:hypothetical protein
MDKMRGGPFAEKKVALRAMAHELHVLRWQGRPSIIKRLLALLVGLALLIFGATFFNSIEASYMDLMDSFIESPGVSTEGVDNVLSTLPSSSIPSTLAPCEEGSGWVEEYISSGVMPRCSLAHRSRIDILYTYFTPFPADLEFNEKLGQWFRRHIPTPKSVLAVKVANIRRERKIRESQSQSNGKTTSRTR